MVLSESRLAGVWRILAGGLQWEHSVLTMRATTMKNVITMKNTKTMMINRTGM